MKMICLCGVSGGGKTTWAKEFLKLNPDYAYFNPDEYYAKFNELDYIRGICANKVPFKKTVFEDRDNLKYYVLTCLGFLLS